MLIDILQVSALLFKTTWWDSIFNLIFNLYFKKSTVTLEQHALNFVGPLTFPVLNTAGLLNLRLDAKGPQIQGANYKLYTNFQLWEGSVFLILTLFMSVLYSDLESNLQIIL